MKQQGKILLVLATALLLCVALAVGANATAYGWYKVDGTFSQTKSDETYVLEANGVEASTASELKTAVANGGYVRLTEDIDMTEKLSISSKTIIIDLNGHTLSRTTSNSTQNDACLIYSDKSAVYFVGEGTISYTNASKNVGIISVKNAGANHKYGFGKDVTVTSNANLYFSGDDLSGVSGAPIFDIYGTMTIKSFARTFYQKNAQINIYDGASLTFSNTTEWISSNDQYINSNCTYVNISFNIYGGTIDFPASVTNLSEYFHLGRTFNSTERHYPVTVYGGSFNKEMPASTIASGKIQGLGEDGRYTLLNPEDLTYQVTYHSGHEYGAVGTSGGSYNFNGDVKTSKFVGKDGAVTLRSTGWKDTAEMQFFGWYTLSGDFYEPGASIVLTESLDLFEAYGVTVSTEADLRTNFAKGCFIRLNADITLSQKLSVVNAVSTIDLNGHTLDHSYTSDQNVDSGCLIFTDFGGAIVLNSSATQGTVNMTKSGNTSSGVSIFRKNKHNKEDSPRECFVIGKNVLIDTNRTFFYANGENAWMNIDVYGTVQAERLVWCYYTSGASINFRDGSALTLIATSNGSYPTKLIQSSDSVKNYNSPNAQIAFNFYEGTFTLPSSNLNAVLLLNRTYSNSAKIYPVTFYGGTVNVELPSDVIDSKKSLQNNNNGTYSVVCNHSWGDGTETTAPTCTTAGVTTFTCSACGKTKTEPISALNHDWDDGEVTTQPTCVDKGVKTYRCQRNGCSAVKTEDVNATGIHTFTVNVPAQTASCTQIGWDAYTTCSVCEEKNGYVEKPMLSHSYTGTVTVTYANGLDQAGLKQVQCANCVATDDTALDAIITVYGYSTCLEDNGQIIAGYSINQNALAIYNGAGKSFTFGVLVGFGDNTVATNFANVIAGNESEKVFGIEVDTSYSRVNVTIDGITANDQEIPLVITAFTKENDTVAYYQKDTGTEITGTEFLKITYAELTAVK